MSRGDLDAPPVDRHKCGHPGVGPKDLRCERCGGILRRCCDSVLSTDHRANCEIGKRA